MYTRFGNLFCFQFKIINKYMYDIIRLWYSVINTKSMKFKKKKMQNFFLNSYIDITVNARLKSYLLFIFVFVNTFQL